MNAEALAKQVALALQAPAIFIGALVVMAGVIWALFAWAYNTRLAAKDGKTESLHNQIDDYKRLLGGKSPDELKGEINVLREIISDGIGWRWSALTRDEAVSITNALLGKEPPPVVQIMYSGELSREIAETISEAVIAGGFPTKLMAGGGFAPGISVGLGSAAAFALKAALSSVPRLGAIKYVDADKDGYPYCWIGVGIKQARD